MLCSGTTFLFSRTTTVLPTTSRYEYLVCKNINEDTFSSPSDSKALIQKSTSTEIDVGQRKEKGRE